MTIRIRFSITIGNEHTPPDHISERDGTATGYLADAGPTDRFLGFTTPANGGDS